MKGRVKIQFLGDDPKALEKYGPLYTSETGADTVSIKLKNSLGKFWLAEVNDIDDRDVAEKLRGTELWLERDKLPTPKKGEYYIQDLIGLGVTDKDGKTIGRVIAFENFGAGDLLEIHPVTGQDFYLPFTKDNVLKIENGTVTVSIPDGLL